MFSVLKVKVDLNRPLFLTAPKNTATNFLTTAYICTTGAGITAAAGTRLALQSLGVSFTHTP